MFSYGNSGKKSPKPQIRLYFSRIVPVLLGKDINMSSGSVRKLFAIDLRSWFRLAGSRRYKFFWIQSTLSLSDHRNLKYSNPCSCSRRTQIVSGYGQEVLMLYRNTKLKKICIYPLVLRDFFYANSGHVSFQVQSSHEAFFFFYLNLW